MPNKKPEISIQEAKETMAVYWKLTGEKIKTPQQLKLVYTVLQDYLKTKQIIQPTIHA